MNYKRFNFIIVIFLFFLAACSPPTQDIQGFEEKGAVAVTNSSTPEPTMTFTPEPTSTSTATPSHTPTITPTSTPTLVFPVSQNTPIPFRSEDIKGSNIGQVQQLATWGESFISSAKYFQDYDTLIVRTYHGFEVLDPETYELRVEIPLDDFASYMDKILDYRMIDEMSISMLINHSKTGEIEVAQLNLDNGKFVSSGVIEHEKRISCGILSEDGYQIGFVDEEGYVSVVPDNNLSNINMVGQLLHGCYGDSTNIFQFSHDGKWLAFSEQTAQTKGVVHLWDVNNLTYIGPVYYGANVITFLPESDTLILASDVIGQVKFIDVPTRQILNVHSPGKNVYDSISVSPSGKLLLSLSGEGEIFIWDIASGAMLSRIDPIGFDESNLDVYMMEALLSQKSVYFHPNENQITLVGTAHSFNKIDFTDGSIIESITGNAHYFTPLFVNQDSNILFADETGLIQIWDIETNQLIKEIQLETSISWMDYASVKNWLFFGDGTEEWYMDLDTYEVFFFSNFHLWNAEISPDQKLLAGNFRGVIRIVDIESRTLLSQFSSHSIGRFQFSPDSKLIAGRLYDSAQGIVVFDVEERYQIMKIPTISERPDFSFSEDGDYLIVSDSTISSDSWFEKWDTEEWEMVEKVNSDFFVQFTLNGKYVINDYNLYLLDDLSNPLVSLRLGYSPVLSEEALFIASTEGGKLFLWGIK